MKIQLIDDWRGAWKLLSFHVTAAWACIFGYLLMAPNALLQAWAFLPEDLRQALPTWAPGAIASAMFLTSFIAARVIKQPVRTPSPEPMEPAAPIEPPK